MEKEIKKGVLVGYKIGEQISVHNNINDPESWFITIRPLQIFGDSLCKKERTEAEIARIINVLLHKKLNTLNAIIQDVLPFT